MCRSTIWLRVKSSRENYSYQQSGRKSPHPELNSWAKGLLSVLLLGIPVAAGTMMGVKIADGRWELLFENSVNEMQHEIVVQQSEVDAGRTQAE